MHACILVCLSYPLHSTEGRQTAVQSCSLCRVHWNTVSSETCKWVKTIYDKNLPTSSGGLLMVASLPTGDGTNLLHVPDSGNLLVGGLTKLLVCSGDSHWVVYIERLAGEIPGYYPCRSPKREVVHVFLSPDQIRESPSPPHGPLPLPCCCSQHCVMSMQLHVQ